MMQHSLWFHVNLLFKNLFELGFSEHLKWHFGIISSCELKFILAFSHCGFIQWQSGDQVLLIGLLLGILKYQNNLNLAWEVIWGKCAYFHSLVPMTVPFV